MGVDCPLATSTAAQVLGATLLVAVISDVVRSSCQAKKFGRVPFGLGRVFTFPSETRTDQMPSKLFAGPIAPPKGGTQLTP